MTGDNGFKLVLASSSARRQDLLRQAGVPFRVIAPAVDETPLPGEKPETCAQRLAMEKAQTVARALDSGLSVLAADTLVVVDHEVLGKPRDACDAVRMLQLLAGRTHRVLTGFALMRSGPRASGGSLGIEESRVRIRAVSQEDARAYVRTGEPMDKAGAYALQGEGARFVESVEGSRSNVIGLPLERILPLLEREGLVTPGRDTR